MLAAWGVPLAVCAQETRAEPSPERTVNHLVQQVLVVVDAVDAARSSNERTEPARNETAGDEAERARATEAIDQGIVPYARTVVALINGELPMGASDIDEASANDARDLFLQLKPKAGGPFVRCELRF